MFQKERKKSHIIFYYYFIIANFQEECLSRCVSCDAAPLTTLLFFSSCFCANPSNSQGCGAKKKKDHKIKAK